MENAKRIDPRIDRPHPAKCKESIGNRARRRHPRRATSVAGNTQTANQPELPIRETHFAELEDGSLVELIEDPHDSEHTIFAVCKDARVQYTDRIEQRGRTLVPMPRWAAGLAEVRLPTAAAPYGSIDELKYTLLNVLKKCLAIPDVYGIIITSYILYTCFSDRLPTAVYLSVFGLPGSGKTTLLEFLHLFCRRPLLVSDITPAAVQDACGRFGLTLLIDENDWGDNRSNRARCQQLRAGTSRTLFARRIQRTGHSFGPKVLSSLEPPDDPALITRCIQIPMTETNQADLIKPTDPRMERFAGNLQQKLLQYRFDFYKSIKPAVIAGAERLRPRARDLLTSLAAPVANDALWCKLLYNFFLRIHEPATVEPLSPAQNAVLAGLFWQIHLHTDEGLIGVGAFGQFVNNLLRKRGERLTLTPRKVGSALSSLIISSKERTNAGWRIWLDRAARQRIHALVKLYGNEYLSDLFLSSLMRNCQMCNETAEKPPASSLEKPEQSEHRAHREQSQHKDRPKPSAHH